LFTFTQFFSLSLPLNRSSCAISLFQNSYHTFIHHLHSLPPCLDAILITPLSMYLSQSHSRDSHPFPLSVCLRFCSPM
jgi:hypothetical protein